MNTAHFDFYSRLILAPIAGVTDRATRSIARELGCPLLFSELISAMGIAVKSRATMSMLNSCRDEHPLVIQIFGKDPDRMGEAAKIVTDLGPDGLDLNLGCPAKTIVKHGSGVALTRDLSRVAEIIAAMRRNTSLPFSVKIRAGWTHEELNFPEVGRIAQEEGADGVIMHARTRAMGFSGEAYWPWIAELKALLQIPVVGNGDVKDGPSAARMLAETGCDGVMIGRAS
ncbi:MAG: tRNA-dihydrouridine synthase family protein, partial [bacterium]